MKKNWLKVILLNLDSIITGGALIATTVLVLVNVFMRYFLNSPLTWSEEVATACFVWAIFMGGAVTFRRKAHLGVDIIVKMLPPRVRTAVEVVNDVIIMVILTLLTYLSGVYVMNSYTKLTNVLQISTAWISSAITLGFGLSWIYGLVYTVQNMKELGKGGRKKEVG